MLDEGEPLLEGETEALKDGVRELLMESESVREYVRDTDGEADSDGVELADGESVEISVPVSLRGGEFDALMEGDILRFVDHDSDGELLDVLEGV
jgi:hypothetical protein